MDPVPHSLLESGPIHFSQFPSLPFLSPLILRKVRPAEQQAKGSVEPQAENLSGWSKIHPEPSWGGGRVGGHHRGKEEEADRKLGRLGVMGQRERSTWKGSFKYLGPEGRETLRGSREGKAWSCKGGTAETREGKAGTARGAGTTGHGAGTTGQEPKGERESKTLEAGTGSRENGHPRGVGVEDGGVLGSPTRGWPEKPGTGQTAGD